MLSNLSVCVSIGLALCQPNVVSDEDITEQKHYSQVDESQINEIIEDILAPSYSREIPNLETLEYVQGYYEYVKEEEIKKARILEQEEQERQYQQWLDSFDNKNYRQTYYSVVENREYSLGSGHNYKSPEVKSINNVMHYNDGEYGWLPVYAIDMNEVMNSGQNEQGTWNLFGSVIELKQGDKTWQGIILDSCGACRYDNKIDLWVYNNQIDLDISNIDWRYVRYGYAEYID